MTMHSVPVPPLPASLAPAPSTAEAFSRMRPLFEQVPEEQLVAINVDIPAVVAMLLAHADAIAGLVPVANDRLKNFDPVLFTELKTRAMALLQAHSLHVTAASPVGDDLFALQESGNVLRQRLLDAAQYLGRQGLIDASRLETIKGLVGYRNLATDLMALSNLLRNAWGVVGSKCAVTEDDLAKATAIAERIFAAVASREQSDRENAASALLRHKAYSLVFREYDEIRRIVTFLRWKQDDADDFAPSLFAGRRNARRDKETSPSPTNGATGKAGGASGPASPAGPASPGAAANGAGGGPVAPQPAVPPGHEGGSPFTG